MNHHLRKLLEIAEKPSRYIIGLMSGTSLDGLDIALCQISGYGKSIEVKLVHFETISYPEEVKKDIREVFAKPVIEFEKLCLLNPWIGNLHASYILQCLQKWGISPQEIDIIASHGQTVFHTPKAYHRRAAYSDATLQIGDGDHIALKTGIITLSDFRQKHIAAGGEGAPLALYGDYLLFSSPDENRVMLNMGGIANFTFLPASMEARQVFVTDTGTGNTLLDAFARSFFNKDYDKDALLALRGTPHQQLLKALKADPFFKKEFPKTTGPELFNITYLQKAQADSNTGSISSYDIMATLTHFSADTISEALKTLPIQQADCTIYTSGGGAHNPLLMRLIKESLGNPTIKRTDDLGIAGDAKEAVLFAVLANETLCSEPVNFNKAGMPAVNMGKISFPS